MNTPKVLWNLFHPNFAQSTGNKILFEAVRDLPNITVNELYVRYPDFKIDIKREQELLVAHDLIVFQFPFYWYSTPALMKQWEDDVLAYGFAYPPRVGNALAGKHWLTVATTGGPQWAYTSGGFNNFTLPELLRPLQQTAYLCGMRWHSPFIQYGIVPAGVEGMTSVSTSEISASALELRKRIESFDLDEHHSLEPVLPPHFHPVKAH